MTHPHAHDDPKAGMLLESFDRGLLVREGVIALDGVALASSFETDAGSPNVGWHQIALEGSWHKGGRSFSLDEPMFRAMVKAFSAKTIDTPADYEHATLWAGIFTEKAPASGWVNDLEVRTVAKQATLWARVEWTDTAAEHIRAREYRYLSPVILFATTDRKTGKLSGPAIHSLALTNTPFLEELPQVELFKASRGAPAPDDEGVDLMDRTKLIEQLDLSADATDEQILEALSAAKAGATEHARLRGALQLSDDVTGDAAVAAAMALSAPKPADPALSQRVEQLEGERLLREAFSSGKLPTPEMREWFKGEVARDPAAARAYLSAAPVVGPAIGSDGGTTEKKRPAGTTVGLTADLAAKRDPKSFTDDEIAAGVAAMSTLQHETCAQLDISPETFARYNMPAILG